MRNSLRITLAVVAVVLLVALIAWGRGTPHHRGMDVGSLGGLSDRVAPAAAHP